MAKYFIQFYDLEAAYRTFKKCYILIQKKENAKVSRMYHFPTKTELQIC